MKVEDALSTTIRAQLSGDDTCSALGLTVKSDSPVLALCRKLVDAGYDATTPLEVYRGDTLALRVKSIGRGAELRVATNSSGRPVFKRQETRAAAPPMRPFEEASSSPRPQYPLFRPPTCAGFSPVRHAVAGRPGRFERADL